LTSLDDINARLWALKDQLRQTEGVRDDALKAAADPAATLSRDEYFDRATELEIVAVQLRAGIADLEAHRRLLRGN
jgi:hypothetical protein